MREAGQSKRWALERTNLLPLQDAGLRGDVLRE